VAAERITQEQKERLYRIMSGDPGPGLHLAVKVFVINEESINGMGYRITVKLGDKVVDVFEEPTMREAKDKFLGEGYRYY
jgi:hypothetical protein